MQDIPNINEVVNLLKLPRKPHTPAGASSYFVRCPFCGDKKYHMSIDAKKGAYYCFRCSGGETGLGTLDLYGRVKFGTRHVHGPGGNGGKLLDALKKDLGKGSIGSARPAIRAKLKGDASAISIASDSKLNQVYSALLDFPPFALSPEHRANLVARGLDMQAIERNRYRTIPADTSWVDEYPQFTQDFTRLGLDGAVEKNPDLQRWDTSQLMAGFILARYLTRTRKMNLYGVPGSFKVAGEWFILYLPGMLIPTRNMKGEIVLFQVRMDKGGTRYVTLSSKSLPCAPKGRISRTHFPLANAPAGSVGKMILTEGALKADVATHLLGEPAFFAAVPGVNNVHELPGILDAVKKMGISTVQCAFDMDKICNRFVRKASENILRIIRQKGLKMTQMVWDRDHAVEMCAELRAVCAQNYVLYRSDPNPFIELSNMAKAMNEAKIVFCEDQSGKHYWCPRTKGIDDYLLSLQPKSAS